MPDWNTSYEHEKNKSISTVNNMQKKKIHNATYTSSDMRGERDDTTQTTAAKHIYAEIFLFQFVLWKSVRNTRGSKRKLLA